MLFLEARISSDMPPAITHPEYYYGFLTTAIAWQVVFLIISTNPVRYRPLLLPCCIEKFAYAIALLWLWQRSRVTTFNLAFGVIDTVLGILFVIALLFAAKPRDVSALAPVE